MEKTVAGAGAGKGIAVMPRFLADENFNNDIIRGLLRRNPDIDITRIQEIGIAQSPDPLVLARAAELGLVLLTHDYDDMPFYVNERILAGLPMPGVVQIPWNLPLSQAIDDLLLLIGCSLYYEWENQVRHLPIR